MVTLTSASDNNALDAINNIDAFDDGLDDDDDRDDENGNDWDALCIHNLFEC